MRSMHWGWFDIAVDACSWLMWISSRSFWTTTVITLAQTMSSYLYASHFHDKINKKQHFFAALEKSETSWRWLWDRRKVELHMDYQICVVFVVLFCHSFGSKLPWSRKIAYVRFTSSYNPSLFVWWIVTWMFVIHPVPFNSIGLSRWWNCPVWSLMFRIICIRRMTWTSRKFFLL